MQGTLRDCLQKLSDGALAPPDGSNGRPRIHFDISNGGEDLVIKVQSALQWCSQYIKQQLSDYIYIYLGFKNMSSSLVYLHVLMQFLWACTNVGLLPSILTTVTIDGKPHLKSPPLPYPFLFGTVMS